MKVGIFRQGDGAQDFYRATLPMLIAEKNKEVTTSQIWQANFLREISSVTPEFEKAMSSDILLMQRFGAKSFMEKIKGFMANLKLSSKIVLDHDDDVFNVSPLSNHYASYGTKEIKIINNNQLIYEWKHGVNIDIDKNLKTMDEFRGTVEMADMVTVTTEGLANVFRKYNPNVRILPNCVDLEQFNKLRIVRDNPKEIRICWYGGNSHWEDLFLIRDVLKEIAAKYENVKIVMVGYKPKGFENDYRPGQVEFHEWVEIAAHPFRLATLDIDIGVIPLKVTDFNNAKSPLKLIEFSALNIPCVASYVTPYKEMADLEEGNAGIFVEDGNRKGWVEGLEMLINSAELRQSIGEKARATVKKNFDINTQYHQWVNAYKDLLIKTPQEVA